MKSWFDYTFNLIECFKYIKDRIISVKRFTDDHVEWYRGYYTTAPNHIKLIDKRFEPRYNMYVSGLTFDWQSFLSDFGSPPPSMAHDKYLKWKNDILVPNMVEYVKTKDIAFDVDRNDKRTPLTTPGSYALQIRDYLKSNGITPIEGIFSGTNGYHIVANDAEKYYEKFDINQIGRTLKSLSWGAIELGNKILDEALPDEPYTDHKKKGRTYGAVSIHFSPLNPQGVRKAPYSITAENTIAIPVTEKELSAVKSIQHYRPENVLKKYRIKHRGCPKL